MSAPRLLSLDRTGVESEQALTGEGEDSPMEELNQWLNETISGVVFNGVSEDTSDDDDQGAAWALMQVRSKLREIQGR